MRRLTLILTFALAALWLPAGAQADFGLKGLELSFKDSGGAAVTQAGSHPFEIHTKLEANTIVDPKLGEIPDGAIRDFRAELPAGLVAILSATPRCAAVDFAEVDSEGRTACPNSAALGALEAEISTAPPAGSADVPIYNLIPPPGVAAKIGFVIVKVPVTINLGVEETPPYNPYAAIANTPQALLFYGSDAIVWGNPSDPAHDPYRGNCLEFDDGAPGVLSSVGNCPANISQVAFLTLPRSCKGPLQSTFITRSWQEPFETLEYPLTSPPGMTGCSKLGFAPTTSAQPTSEAASSPSGLDFSLDVSDPGLANPSGIADADIEAAEVTLPEGMSANPSLAEGLEVCSEAELEFESAKSAPGEGCPNASKIGSLEVETPLLVDKLLKGSLYIAKPYENPFNSLLALYIVIKDPELGISVTQAARVEPDPVTGQLTTVTEDLPQLPFSHFRLHFREGTRSPLVTPPACGPHTVKAVLYPSSGNPPLETTSAFEIVSGPNNGPCPSGGLPSFKPGLIAGTNNNRAGSFSPFYLRLFRSDSEQEITHFSIKLPPGITGKLAGIPYCSDAAIEAAKARTGPHGGQEELDSPSCPAASEIGRTLAGAGVGPSLTYAPGKVYLAGPYHGSPLSMVAITAGVVGPFDIGTVVVREAFKINPETAEVFIDSTGSDPIPHIVRGIPVHLRDIRAYVDKPNFVLNPTDCTATSTASTVLGSGLDFVSEADDNPITVTSPFQAADCAALPFAPQLTMRLIGGTRRGAHPKFTAHLAMNGIGEAGIDHATVLLPRSEFIENAHFNTICTRVQFKEGVGNGAACPAGSIYGHARAVTPILSEPLEGPVFLRSNPERQLPDVVAALHNAQVDFDLVGHVDSVKGQLRNTFEAAPDAPVTSFDLELEGGSKGLFVNSVNLCKKKNRAKADFTGQNGKVYESKPVLQVKCKGKAKRRHKRHAKRGRR